MVWEVRRRRGPWALALAAVIVGVIAVRCIGRIGAGDAPEQGTWSSSAGERLVVRDGAPATWTDAAGTVEASLSWEPPLLHVQLPDGRRVTFVRDGVDLARAGGEHPPYRREP